jgi:hypothetical protein
LNRELDAVNEKENKTSSSNTLESEKKIHILHFDKKKEPERDATQYITYETRDKKFN